MGTGREASTAGRPTRHEKGDMRREGKKRLRRLEGVLARASIVRKASTRRRCFFEFRPVTATSPPPHAPELGWPGLPLLAALSEGARSEDNAVWPGHGQPAHEVKSSRGDAMRDAATHSDTAHTLHSYPPSTSTSTRVSMASPVVRRSSAPFACIAKPGIRPRRRARQK